MTFELIGDERVFLCCFRLTCVRNDGVPYTASCFAYKPPTLDYALAVTAAHAVEGAEHITVHVPLGTLNARKTRIVSSTEIKLAENPFSRHPDDDVDIAIAGLGNLLGGSADSVVAHLQKDVSNPNLVDFDALTKQVRYLGFPENRYDPKLGVGILRTGWSASPFSISQAPPEFPKLTVDGEFFEGNSGGPAFRYDQHVPSIVAGYASGSGTRFQLLGVVVEASANTSKEDPEVPLAIGYIESIEHVDNCAKALSNSWGEHEEGEKELFDGWPNQLHCSYSEKAAY
jgi:hypothetical protein